MELVLVLGFLILAVVIYFLLQLLLRFIHVVFFTLVLVLVMVYFFGISYYDLVFWVGKALLLVL